jgi:hypothetical protein
VMNWFFQLLNSIVGESFMYRQLTRLASGRANLRKTCKLEQK